MCGMDCTDTLISDIVRKRKRRVIIDLDRNEVKVIEAVSDDETVQWVVGEDKPIDWSVYEGW